MGEERLESVDRIYRAALNVEPGRRPAFLNEACAGDESLRLQIEFLLDSNREDSSSSLSSRTQLVPARRRQDPTYEPGIRWFAPSQVIADRFEIIAFVGQGGMGDVYEAKDLHLGEHVALKTIRPEFASDERMITHFKQEILLAKKVTHPNICRIYDVGFHHDKLDPAAQPKMFLTMELLRGKTLSSRLHDGPMTETEALPIVRQMAQGLHAAHQAGVVHRDFKTGNVILTSTSSGTRAVITDFGLARAMHSDRAVTASLTRGEIVGTPDYMAPEQLTGRAITPSVDIYAMGIVMYEMVSGALPFDADTAFAALAKRLHEDAPSPRIHVPTLDGRWEAVILKCLAREPSQRFASTIEATDALTSGELPKLPRKLSRRAFLYTGTALAAASGASIAYWRLTSSSAQPSIAVLPFINADSESDYFSDGITEELINTLGQRDTLRVMSRAAVYRHKGSNLGPQELGRTLKVGFLLTGRVDKRGPNTSVAVELTDARNGLHLWGQQYQRPVAEISAIEEDISREVLNKLQLVFSPDDRKRLANRRSSNAEANDFYWKGRYFWNKRTQEGLKKAVEYFSQAVALDPQFALAYTGLADAYAMQSGIVHPLEVFPKAKSAAQQALQLDNTLAEAHTSLAFTHLFFDWDWLQTEKEYKRAIQLNPNYASAHSMFGMYLTAMSRFDEALVEMKRALQLDPGSLAIHTGVGRVLFYARRYRDAAEHYTDTLELNAEFSEALFDLGRTRAAQGRPDQAIQLLERGLKAAGSDAGAIAEMAFVYRKAGRKAEAERSLDALRQLATKRYVSPYFFAAAQVGANNEATLDFLEQAYQDRSFSMIYLDVDPRFDQLRSNPRYQRLLQRMGFAAKA
ncbi:MAG TPA: protein kinase [Bryobacteraceae bacterium]|nr:protein kinase [Bryobacteraceae bacterium]